MDQLLESLEFQYLEIFSEDISQELKIRYLATKSGDPKLAYSFWKFFGQKVLQISNNQESKLTEMVQELFTGLCIIIEQSFKALSAQETINNFLQNKLKDRESSEKSTEKSIEKTPTPKRNSMSELEKQRSSQEDSKELEKIEILKAENQTLEFKHNELLITVEQLIAKSRPVREKPLRTVPTKKIAASAAMPILKPNIEKKTIVPKQAPPKKQPVKPKLNAIREITIKQLKDYIEDIYVTKTKFDAKCYEDCQPRETMDQYLYTYLSQKYGLKNLISEWSLIILKAIEKYEHEDSEVLLFSKILNNRINEEYQQNFDKLKENMKQLLKAKLQQRNPFMREMELNSLVKEKINGVLDDDEWATIIVSMYSQKEAQFMIGNLKTLLEEQFFKLSAGRRNKLIINKTDATYNEVQNFILSYDLLAHEAYIGPLWNEFSAIDTDEDGIISIEEFRKMVANIGMEDRFDRLLATIDPNDTGYTNFSDCVTLFMYEMVTADDETEISVINWLSSSHRDRVFY
ncbi:hypothetical protein SteCoe_16344 [Stentor coeruleus]|uniref:EF-hand domain-containing protein n=1 Tax=Stentor coeruleus TaxID=5963 RepID=A0A1R2C1L6_9CILI|nr:hypothetical protein SteCoe_16344 [Stentor coeruleus]